MENVPSVAELLNRTQRLEAALRRVERWLAKGWSDSSDIEGMVFHGGADREADVSVGDLRQLCAALVDKSRSCCEEVRRETRTECDKEWNEATAFASQPKTPTMREIIDAHDAEVRRAALEEAAQVADRCVLETTDMQPQCKQAQRYVAQQIRVLSNQVPPKSHIIIHRVAEEGLAPACKTEGATRTTTDEAEVTCRRCLVLFGWCPTCGKLGGKERTRK